MIYKNKDFLLTIFGIVFPYYESLNNNQELAIINLITSIFKNHFFDEKNNRIPLA